MKSLKNLLDRCLRTSKRPLSVCLFFFVQLSFKYSFFSGETCILLIIINVLYIVGYPEEWDVTVLKSDMMHLSLERGLSRENQLFSGKTWLLGSTIFQPLTYILACIPGVAGNIAVSFFVGNVVVLTVFIFFLGTDYWHWAISSLIICITFFYIRIRSTIFTVEEIAKRPFIDTFTRKELEEHFAKKLGIPEFKFYITPNEKITLWTGVGPLKNKSTSVMKDLEAYIRFIPFCSGIISGFYIRYLDYLQWLANREAFKGLSKISIDLIKMLNHTSCSYHLTAKQRQIYREIILSSHEYNKALYFSFELYDFPLFRLLKKPAIEAYKIDLDLQRATVKNIWESVLKTEMENKIRLKIMLAKKSDFFFGLFCGAF